MTSIISYPRSNFGRDQQGASRAGSVGRRRPDMQKAPHPVGASVGASAFSVGNVGDTASRVHSAEPSDSLDPEERVNKEVTLRPRKYSLAGEIREQINAGDLPPGSVLPSLSDLCAVHQAAPGTMRAALAIVENEGLIVTVQGAGSYVRVPGMLPATAQLAIDVLRGRIASGELAAGAALPSRPELASEFALSQATVKLVVRSLREAGVVEVREGIGVFVTDPTRPTGECSNHAA